MEKTRRPIESFAPTAIREHTDSSKTCASTLFDRVYATAATHAALLSATLTSQLQDFKAGYDAARNAQQQGKGTVDDNIAERYASRMPLELAILQAIHEVADQYPGNVEQCVIYFDFTLLFPQTSPGEKDEKEPTGGGKM